MEADEVEEEAVEPEDVLVSCFSTWAVPSCGARICSNLFGASVGELSGKRSGLASRSALLTNWSTESMIFLLVQSRGRFGKLLKRCRKGVKFRLNGG